jgi:hypothetical protein
VALAPARRRSTTEDRRCRTCRKAHAAPFDPTARVPREQFKILSGVDKLRAFEFSPGRLRHFCSLCGSHISAEQPADPHVVLRVAKLDDDPGAVPLIHIWKATKYRGVLTAVTSRSLSNGRRKRNGTLS